MGQRMAAAVRKITEAEMIGRRETARSAALDREDLFLLMESYQNTISLNTTLLERQDTLNANIERTIQELLGICENQAKILEEIRRIGPITQKRADAILAELVAARVAEVKEHSGHNNRIYVALVGMVGIVVTLIGLLFRGAK